MKIPKIPKNCPYCGSIDQIEVVNTAKMRYIREDAGYSLRSVAEAIGISASYLSDMELGRRSMSEEVATKIFTVIGVNTK